MSEHLRHVEVERLHAVALYKGEVGITGGLTDDIERCTLALGHLAHALHMLVLDEQSHAFLTLVGDNLFRRQRLVTDGQLGHIYLTAAVFHELGETVEVSGRTMVMNRRHGVGVVFHKGAHEVVGALLHLRVGTLHGVELYGSAVAAGVY